MNKNGQKKISKDSETALENQEVSPEDEKEELQISEILDALPAPFEQKDQGSSGAVLASGDSLSSSGGVISYDPLDQYLAEIRRYPPLTREEEHELALQYRNFGDREAAYKLVVSNLRLVIIIAREYQKNFQNILDLVQEGNIGLLEAVKQFDPLRGIRFPSYAAYWIRAYILRYLINNIRLVKVGTTQAQRKLFFNLQKEKDRLEAEGFVPEARLLAERLGVKESEVIEMESRLALPDLSVDAPVSAVDDHVDYHGIIPDHGADLERQVLERQFGEAIRDAVSEFKKNISEREKAIVDRRLFTDEPATLQEIADEFGVSRERIRQIESKLKADLKIYLATCLQMDPKTEIMTEGD